MPKCIILLTAALLVCMQTIVEGKQQTLRSKDTIKVGQVQEQGDEWTDLDGKKIFNGGTKTPQGRAKYGDAECPWYGQGRSCNPPSAPSCHLYRNQDVWVNFVSSSWTGPEPDMVTIVTNPQPFRCYDDVHMYDATNDPFSDNYDEETAETSCCYGARMLQFPGIWGYVKAHPYTKFHSHYAKIGEFHKKIGKRVKCPEGEGTKFTMSQAGICKAYQAAIDEWNKKGFKSYRNNRNDWARRFEEELAKEAV